jgi:hypothetical protein
MTANEHQGNTHRKKGMRKKKVRSYRSSSRQAKKEGEEEEEEMVAASHGRRPCSRSMGSSSGSSEIGSWSLWPLPWGIDSMMTGRGEEGDRLYTRGDQGDTTTPPRLHHARLLCWALLLLWPSNTKASLVSTGLDSNIIDKCDKKIMIATKRDPYLLQVEN